MTHQELFKKPDLVIGEDCKDTIEKFINTFSYNNDNFALNIVEISNAKELWDKIKLEE